MIAKPYVVILFRNHKQLGKSRHYIRLDTAIPKCVNRLLVGGEPGDKFIIMHADFQFRVGFVSMNKLGRINIRFYPDITNTDIKV